MYLGAGSQQQGIITQMPYLHRGLSESFQPSLEGFSISILNSGEVSRILKVSPTLQELRGKPRSQILPTRDGVGW